MSVQFVPYLLSINSMELKVRTPTMSLGSYLCRVNQIHRTMNRTTVIRPDHQSPWDIRRQSQHSVCPSHVGGSPQQGHTIIRFGRLPRSWLRYKACFAYSRWGDFTKLRLYFDQEPMSLVTTTLQPCFLESFQGTSISKSQYP